MLFPPQRAGGNSVAVIHVPRVNRFRVVSSETGTWSTSPATTIGDFRSSDAAAACVEDALQADLHAEATKNGAATKDGAA